jgi:hypothetical protein
VAKQVKVDNKKDGRLVTRSPFTNLIFAAILGLIYVAVLNQSPAQAIVYAIGAFLFFNTVDYFILYYRLRKLDKTPKETK